MGVRAFVFNDARQIRGRPWCIMRFLPISRSDVLSRFVVGSSRLRDYAAGSRSSSAMMVPVELRKISDHPPRRDSGTLLFQFRRIRLCRTYTRRKKEKERICSAGHVQERSTLPFTSIWMVCESERPCLFLAVHLYAPRSLLLSTLCNTNVPFADTSCLRLVGKIWSSASYRKRGFTI